MVEGSGPNAEVWSLRQQQCMYKECRVELALGPTRAMHKTDAVMLVFPRIGGSRFLWNVKPF